MTSADDAPRPRVIVIGAGVAGSVVASRLESHCDVVVLERGAGSRVIHDPTLAMQDSGFEESLYPQGTGPGGGSRVNGMVLAHAPDDYWNSLLSKGLDVFADAYAEQASFVGEVSPCDGVVDRALRSAHPDARPTMLATRNGVRLAAWDRLAPHRVTLSTGVTVSHLTMRGERAVGVVTSRGDELAADHVILCAGAIPSAVLATRSGIVGEETRLLDHPALFIPLVGEDRDAPDSLAAQPSCNTYAGVVLDEGGASTMSINGGAEGPSGLLVALMSPRSSGRLSVDHDSVLIDRGFFTDSRDLNRLAAGVRRAAQLLSQPSFRRLTSPVRSMLDGDDWQERVGDGVWHASGTLPMGIEASCPLDESGKFRGTANVWCMDASVFPVIPPVPPQASVMVASGLLTNRFLSLVTS
jgi:choline dehydrogenase-like flavoprotein